jgi:hypothetical protein
MAYPLDTYTKLACHFNKVDGSKCYGLAVTVGTAQLDTAQSRFGGSSLLLDGNSDYITFPDSADWDFGNGDFTIDAFVRFNALPASTEIPAIAAQYGNSDGERGWRLTAYYSGTNYAWRFVYSVNGLTAITNTIVDNGYEANIWYHIAFVRSGDSGLFFRNGSAIGNVYNFSGATINPNAQVLSIGTFNVASPVNYFNGYIDELRISKGIARWTQNFTPPTREYVSDQYTTLLLHCNGADASTLIPDCSGGDESGNNKVATYGVSLSTLQVASKFGASALAVTGGSSSYQVTFPNSTDFNFAAGDFTVDLWFNLTGLPSNNATDILVSHYSGAGAREWAFGVRNESGTIYLRSIYSTDGTAITSVNSTAATITTGVWYHSAFVRNGNNLYNFLDGVKIATIDVTGVTLFAANIELFIPGLGPAAQMVKGYMDELRISKGIARWTANFNPPERPYGYITKQKVSVV